jgi:hypothetical protein
MPKAMYGFQRYFRVICLTTFVVSVILVAVFQYNPFEHETIIRAMIRTACTLTSSPLDRLV